ncbi:putative cytochrome p450 protein [Botrytis fragariae]|uniref:Putative cytochrome p450 protein n=1 Tax=Botrytis fragariae TaxID=1964551 RepID=A0A8H6AKJ9_9HELO|nr:putative cytochrome p450 protein [Botrytis fragariae]KAF5868985.1 putative cytochrome p450 protein [Botrytis fragariae]
MINFNETVARGREHQRLSLAIVFMILYTASTLAQYLRTAKVPLVGSRFFLEPQFVTNFRFFCHAGGVLNDGYDRFKHTTFKFIRADTEILVLPAKYINELRNLPSTIASPTLAHVHNLTGRHTNMDVILRNNLHFRTL